LTPEEEYEFNKINKNEIKDKNVFINYFDDNTKSSENDKIEDNQPEKEKSIITDEITKNENHEIKQEDTNSISNLPLIKIDTSSKTINNSNENNFSKTIPVYYVLRIVLCEGKNLAIRDVGGKILCKIFKKQ
jgi:hypothetical protein